MADGKVTTSVKTFPTTTQELMALSDWLTAAYHMLKDGTLYQNLGANHFNNRDKGKQALRLVNRLQSLGFAVHITSMSA
ncbi:MAG: hypothetical protein WBE74_00510 [Terracidiphilus sp.]